ncbi:hypothetical protein [uncultured Cohaesibacter sp.]|uniref:hypothetical protein n=1 Tax=uncultured Cohaesibacter sp. TaxID=1002546 RepID=UPI00292FA230|nr:hypothetical protein [uncultured Cohaesibacter sp.]
MEAQDFLFWMERVGIKTGLDLEKTLGWSRVTAQKNLAAAKSGELVTLKVVDELAMSAIAQGLKKWSDYDR